MLGQRHHDAIRVGRAHQTLHRPSGGARARGGPGHPRRATAAIHILRKLACSPSSICAIPSGRDEPEEDPRHELVCLLQLRARGVLPFEYFARSETVPVPAWHREILDQRLKDLDANPDAGDSWDVVQERLRRKLDKEH